MTACAHCERLRSEETAASRVGDYSRATDCRVLLRRHPHRSGAAAPEQTSPVLARQ